MMYMGGKVAIATQIAQEILTRSEKIVGGGTLVSLFCGACSVEAKLAPWFKTVICNDLHADLINLWRYVQAGLPLPDKVSEDEWRFIKEHKALCSPLTAFCGFGVSFGGRWFTSYARSKKCVRGYADESKRGLLRKIQTLEKVRFICNDYRDVELPPNSVIYADPPYEGVTGYCVGKFDSKAFWEYMRQISAQGHLVYISECNAPDDFIPIWQKQIHRTLNDNKAQKLDAIEKLYIPKGQERR